MHAVQVVESAKANGTNNHGLDGNRLFVGVSCAAGSPASTASASVGSCYVQVLHLFCYYATKRSLHCYARQRSSQQGGHGEAHSIPCQGQDWHDPQAAVAPNGELLMC